MVANIPSDIELFTIPELCEMLDSTPSKIRRMIEDSQLGSVRADGVLCVPALFLQDNEPLQSLRGTLLALRDGGFSAEEAVAWLLAESEELGEAPVAALRSGKKSAVRRATQALAF